MVRLPDPAPPKNALTSAFAMAAPKEVSLVPKCSACTQALQRAYCLTGSPIAL